MIKKRSHTDTDALDMIRIVNPRTKTWSEAQLRSNLQICD